MEERSLKVYNQDKAFFMKISNTFNKFLMPTKVGLNSFLITLKRNNVIKAYEASLNIETIELAHKKEAITRKFDDSYALYLESIDKNIMSSIYEKVKNDSASEFEKKALSDYYMVTHLKETGYTEYKYKKQIYLLKLDYETIYSENLKVLGKFKKFYSMEMEILYKGLLKHYSVKLSDNISNMEKQEVFVKIFTILEEYISNILPIKMEVEDKPIYKEILEEFKSFEKFSVGKIDQNEVIEKNVLLLGISRKLFTHSLPLVVAEQCYNKILDDVRVLMADSKMSKKQEKAYSLGLKLIEEYYVKLLGTKIYWDKPSKRDEFKVFWDKFNSLAPLKETNNEEYMKQIQELFIRMDLKAIMEDQNKYHRAIIFYKSKLVELGFMKAVKNKFVSEGRFIKKKKIIRDAV